MNKEKGNKLIAEFLGNKKIKNHDGYHIVYGYRNGDTSSKDLEYHICWAWLMPVVAKINKMQHDPKGCFVRTTVERLVNFCEVTSLHITSNIELVWDRVVNFIQWYNSEQNLKRSVAE